MKVLNTLLSLSFLMVMSSQLMAQTGDVHMVNMSEMLFYVIPFYLITFVALCLFLQKLIRPKTSNKWLYLCTFIGIVGAAIVTTQFKKVQDEQLPKAGIESVERPEKLSEKTKQRLDQINKEVRYQQYANFWIIGMPNVILLVLGVVVDRVQRKEE